VMDVLRANSGNFLWFGQPGSPQQRRKIGSLLETPNFYSYLSGTDNLKITQAISGRGNAKDIEAVLKKVNLYDRRWSSFKSFSLGMKQRLAIGAALLGDPKVLVLDEPTNGLDPEGIAEIRRLIVELKEKGHTIIMASHLLDEVEKVCTHAAILKTGNLITTGNVEEIMMDEDIVELSAANIQSLLKVLNNMGKEVLVDEKANTVQIIFPKGTAKMDELNQHCFNNGVVLTQLVLRKKRLETRFFELTNN
ncbi:MAG: ATP-binding cassette domain-containing protein, partial [Chitinophagaceae bacterium]|nr:ATP-binding cassette domain-containing protein [Chitinophagaceae bacterium]